MGNWQIVLAEQNMNLGRWDNLIFGKDTCHSYLVLKNPEGGVVSEMHGTTWHPKKNRLNHGGGSLQAAAKSIFSSLNLSKPFEAVARRLNDAPSFPRLKCVVTKGPWAIDKAQHEQVVMEGDKQSVLTEWLDACKVGDIINDLDLFYTPLCKRTFGQNCNAVTHTFLHAMGIDLPRESFNLAAVGYNNKLYEHMPELAKFDTEGNYDPEEMDELLGFYTENPDGLFMKSMGGYLQAAEEQENIDPAPQNEARNDAHLPTHD